MRILSSKIKQSKTWQVKYMFSSVLDLMTALTAVAGGLNMDGPREALVGTLCRFALPPGYHEKSYAGEQTSGSGQARSIIFLSY